MTEHIYDIIIVGGGPAGYTSALYGSRAGLDTLVIEKFSAGGQMTQTSQIDNYPGFEQGIDGFSLGFKMQAGAERFGAKTLTAEVLSLNLIEKIKSVETSNGSFYAKSVIIATGAEHKHLGINGESALIGKGVSYCAACDGMFYKGKTVAVVGGGNSAATDALLLSNICKKIYLIHRRDALRAEKFYHEPLLNAKNIEFVLNSILCEFLYNEKVVGVKIKDIKNNNESKINVDGVFISIGRSPETRLLTGQVNLDKSGYVVADETTQTSIPGVFAIGDVRTKPLRQIVTAVADGATAIHFAQEYLNEI